MDSPIGGKTDFGSMPENPIVGATLADADDCWELPPWFSYVNARAACEPAAIAMPQAAAQISDLIANSPQDNRPLTSNMVHESGQSKGDSAGER
jgi:hypothetical protein